MPDSRPRSRSPFAPCRASRAGPRRASRCRRCPSCCRSRAGRVALAPAAHLAVVEDRAGVVPAARDRDRRSSRAQVHRPHRARRLVVADVPPCCRSRAGPLDPQPQQRTLPLSRIAQVWRPPPVIAHRRSSRAEIHRPHRARRLVVADAVRVAVAELPVDAVAPAAHLALVEDRAGVIEAGGDRARRSSRAQIDRADRRGRLVVADVLRVAVAELRRTRRCPSSAPGRCRDGRS